MRIDIPGYKVMDIQHIVLDYNGTIAVDGIVKKEVKRKIDMLANQFSIYILTADTHGTAVTQCEDMPVIIKTFPKDNAAEYKRAMIEKLGQDACICFGNGRNDCLMFREAGLSVAVLGEEGMYAQLLAEADLCVRTIEEGLELLIKPQRFVAGLRG